MVGPGLFFALLALGAFPARAETAVGLDAQGVDPMVALHNDSGLDVRDELGRPVSAQKVADGLKQAQAKAASEAAFASRLPQAAAVAALLEMIEALRLFMRGGTAGLPPMRLFALAPSQRSAEKAVPLSLIVLGCTLLAASAAAAYQPAVRPSRAPAVVVMRC